MIRLAVRVARAEAEVVLAELLELVPSGLEERDAGHEEDAGVRAARLRMRPSLFGVPGCARHGWLRAMVARRHSQTAAQAEGVLADMLKSSFILR